jgi:hypothetical protein
VATVSGAPYDKLRLTALRYAVNDEAEQYIARHAGVHRRHGGPAVGPVRARGGRPRSAATTGLELDTDVVDSRLSYLVQAGNLARSPRETEARSIREYLTTRARYQLTQRGELVHRQVEELLGATDEVREVSTEMLGGILPGCGRSGRTTSRHWRRATRTRWPVRWPPCSPSSSGSSPAPGPSTPA